MNCMLSKAIEYISVSFPAHKRGGFGLFHLFGVTSGLLQVVLGFPGSLQPAQTCYSLFQVPLITNDDFTKYFDLQIYKRC